MTDEPNRELACPRCRSALIVAEHEAIVVQRVELDASGEIDYLGWRSDDVHLGRQRFCCADCGYAAVDWRAFLGR